MTTPSFLFNPFFSGCACGACGDSMFGLVRCFMNQRDQSIQSVLSVLLLRPVPMRLDDEVALFGETISRELDQSALDISRQILRMQDIEPELNRSRNLVDVLSTRS